MDEEIKLITDPEVLVKSKVWDVRGNQPLMIDLLQKMSKALDQYKDRLFICSNEVGYEERGILVKFADDSHEFFNPAFQKKDVPILNREKDIMTGDEYFVPRFTTTEIVYQDCLGSVKANKLNEAASVIMCQAMDLLNGITAKDYGLPILEGFDNLTNDEKSEILADYVKSLGNRYKTLDEELSNDEETKEIWSTSKYIKGVSNGSIETTSELSNRKKKKLKKLADQLSSQTKKLKFWGGKK